MSDNHARREARGIAAVALLVVVALCASAGNLVINDSDDNQLIRFESDGDIVLSRGWIVEHARLHEWTSELNPRDPVEGGAEGIREFIVRGQAGEVVALLDEKRGNLYLRGQADQVANLQADPNEHELIISAGGVPQAIIDEDGNLTYRGNVTEPTPAAQRQSLADQYLTLGYDFFDHEDYADIDEAGENICYKFANTDSYVNPGSFSLAELQCHHDALPNAHGDWQWDETVSRMFQEIRDEYGASISTITSGFRCPTKNNSIPGTNTEGKHAYGRAFDVQHLVGGVHDTQMHWDVAVAAENVGVPDHRIRLYPEPADGNTVRTLEWFQENMYDAANLPPGWNYINRIHIDSGQPGDDESR